ncbi:hypothetical protein BED46_026475 [Burkholderia contaminans]|jgi:hypothetical protein|nr:hypothetical protein WR31_24345 [Burkholderia contaminans LMG 23361]MBA9834825.1 hypothetical protein [Burkholderia contaminans]MBA9842706.1 hypothetical protein [Burkholderia contaminans]MBA9867471.1 hypothetical protein [Burkholderia contaminans]MBA9910107.1 hypothetical protein [Burkholderia contaminans]
MCQPLAISTHRAFEESPLLTALTIAGLVVACLITTSLWLPMVFLFGKSMLFQDVNNTGMNAHERHAVRLRELERANKRYWRKARRSLASPTLAPGSEWWLGGDRIIIAEVNSRHAIYTMASGGPSKRLPKSQWVSLVRA